MHKSPIAECQRRKQWNIISTPGVKGVKGLLSAGKRAGAVLSYSALGMRGLRDLSWLANK